MNIRDRLISVLIHYSEEKGKNQLDYADTAFAPVIEYVEGLESKVKEQAHRLEMNDEMINLEQAHTRFEVWITAQLPRANLNRGSNGEHTDQLVNAMFVAFSAGMITAGVDIDWAKG